MLRCEELFEALVEYIDGELDAETTAAIERHLEKCPVCELVVDYLRKTISVFCCHGAIDVPPDFQKHLDGLLREHWQAKFSSNAASETPDRS